MDTESPSRNFNTGEEKWIQIPLPLPGKKDEREPYGLKIFIADPHAMVREGIKKILMNTDGFFVVGEAGSGPEVFTKLETVSCDLVLLDISTSEGKGLHVLKKLKEMRPGLPVLVTSVYPEDHYAARAIRAGADGYLTKEKTTEELLKAILKISTGKKYISLSLAEKLTFDNGFAVRYPAHNMLSKREFQVLCQIAEGQTIKEIAGKFKLNTHTISTYRSRLLKKMGMENDAEVVYYAHKEGLVD
jgi:two-component system invasion response regulator UvrY